MNLISNLHIVLALRLSGDIPHIPQYAYMAGTGITLLYVPRFLTLQAKDITYVFIIENGR